MSVVLFCDFEMLKLYTSVFYFKSLTSFGQNCGSVYGDILKGNRSLFHSSAQTSHKCLPCQHQITRGWVQDPSINAVTDHVVVWRFWINICIDKINEIVQVQTVMNGLEKSKRQLLTNVVHSG